MGDKEQVAAKQQEAPDRAPPVIQPPADAPPPQAPPVAPAHLEDRDRISKSDRIMIAATIFIAFGTLVSAGAICFQWYEMHTGAVDTKNLADAAGAQVILTTNLAIIGAAQEAETKELAGHMKDQADATRQLASDTEASTSLAQQSLHTSERAYIFPELVITEGPHNCNAPGGSNRLLLNCASFSYRNFGKTPAINVVVTGGLFFNGVSPTVLEGGPPPYDDTQGITVAANDSKPAQLYGQRADMATTRDMNARYFLVGYIQYTDIFSERQAIPFCLNAPVNPTPGRHDPEECRKPQTQANQGQNPN
jgi:hypothetical protein